MNYNNIKSAVFISRPNRFIANVEVDGKTEVCHVKNTGRCKELLIHGAKVYVEKSENPQRKTKYDLISVYKGDNLINIDSQAPNKVFYEWATESGFFGEIAYIKPEYKYKNSRFDCYIETKTKKILVEVKGVTLENDGVAMFPDAPTQRGVKHVKELMEAIDDGFDAYVFFVVQMSYPYCFTPNRSTHKEFAEVLSKAKKHGVNVKALSCIVTENTLQADSFIETVID